MKIKLSDAFELQMGKTPARNEPAYWGGTNKWVSIGDMGFSDKFISSTKETISDIGVQESGIKLVPKGTVTCRAERIYGKYSGACQAAVRPPGELHQTVRRGQARVAALRHRQGA